MSADGTHRRKLTKSLAEDAFPSWSPDGKTIAFTHLTPARTDIGGYEIYVIGVDGTGLRRLTRARGFDTGPVWAPDGTRIAYYHELGDLRHERERQPPQAAYLLAGERRQPDLVAGRSQDRVRRATGPAISCLGTGYALFVMDARRAPPAATHVRAGRGRAAGLVARRPPDRVREQPGRQQRRGVRDER